MNAVELLEALLRGPAAGKAAPSADTSRPAPRGSAPTGADILRDILGGGQDAPTAPAPAPRPAPTSGGAATGNLPREGKADVQEMIRRAEAREAAAASGRPYPPASTVPVRRPVESQEPRRPAAAPQPAATSPRAEEATVLIRAMINAARADGRLDRDEEQKILRHLGEPSPEVVAFIQAEFQKPLDVREFAWSVPLGLEQKVYAISLSVIELDQREESAYLGQLAHGLRLPPDLCAEIHHRMGAPVIS
jgi:uncharacterized membrane protein YebE (DUF533 family)